MYFENYVHQKIKELLENDRNYTIERNRKRGQSDTYTIFNHENKPVFIAKFFDYLSDVKDDIRQENINKFNSLAELFDNIDELDNIPLHIDDIVNAITLQQRCFTRYVNVCNITNLDCFPKVSYSEEEVAINNSFYGFLIESYVDGVTLESILPVKDNELKSDFTLDFLIQLGKIIKELNINGVVHRDISPDNIMYIDGNYVVIDPGMVKYSDDNPSTQSSMMLGKHFYVSPEQYFGNAKTATFKSDLYAIGIISLEIILGYNPLERIMTGEQNRYSPHDSLLSKYNRKLEDEIFKNIEENQFNSRLLLIIKKLIQIKDMHRFASIDAFITAVTSLEKRYD